jgi:hypothetical protein
MGPRWRTRSKRAALCGLAIWLLLALFAHPYFAVTRPSGGTALVAEGWMHEEGLKEAALTFDTGAYRRLYVTGTLRPFAYYLKAGDTIIVRFTTAMSGRLRIGVGGLPGAYAEISGDPLAHARIQASGGLVDSEYELNDCHGLRIAAGCDNPPPGEADAIFIGRLKVNGTNVHALNAEVRIRGRDGIERPGRPTFADQGAMQLAALGVPADRITVVRTLEVHRSRTWSNAKAFTAYADAHRIERFDVATLGVHARRTWRMYQLARGQRGGAGIISLHDPWCKRWTWWANPYGWYQVVKEIVALPAPLLVADDGADGEP